MTFDAFLKAACPPLNLNWRKYRRHASRHRVDARLEQLGLDSYAEYLERLRSDSDEAGGLADRMSVTVSRFFRERERWEILATRVLPILAREAAGGPLRAWCIGCCGGEEPYTLALLRRQCRPVPEMEILGTDVDGASLERARRARYSQSSLREVPKGVRERYFHRRDGLWQLTEEIKGEVRFLRHNFLREPPPGRFDLLCCRYLAFTYYCDERLLEAGGRLHLALEPGGALMIGRREELGAALQLFRPWPGAPGVFLPCPWMLDGRPETANG